MPSFLARENKNKVPHAALWLTNIVIQAFLLVTYFAEYAFTLALKMTSSMTLIPYFLVAAYGFKLAWTGETYAATKRGRGTDCVRGMLVAGGAKFLLLSALLYAPGTILFVLARREQKQMVFMPLEGFVFACVVIAAVIALCGLVFGTITI
jgi:arginine:ornithine antiporter/lysine permease